MPVNITNTTDLPGGETMTMHWDAGLIVISYLVSVQSAYTALQILQMRISVWLIAVAALCLSASGIWSMHFIGMAAMTIDADVSYDLGWTIASVIFAYVPTFGAFWIIDHAVAKRKRLVAAARLKRKEEAQSEGGNTTSDEGDEDDTRDVSINAHIRAIVRAPHLHILLGGSMIALGVCLMHYLGMHAMSVPGMVRTINAGVVVASCFIALFAGTAALYFAFVLPSTREYTLPTAFVAGVAVSGMHYVGMYGIRYETPVSGMGHGTGHMSGSSSSSIDPYVVYIIFVSSLISSASLALSSYFYRGSLRKAADEAELRVSLIMRGKFDQLGNLEEDEDDSRLDPIMARLKRSNAKLGDQMQKLRSFLPPSLLAQFESAEGYTSGDENEDEGDLTMGYTVQASVTLGHQSRSTELLHQDPFESEEENAAFMASTSPRSLSVPRSNSKAMRGASLSVSGAKSKQMVSSTNSPKVALAEREAAVVSKTVRPSRQQYNHGLEQRNVAILSLNCHGFNQLLTDSNPQFMQMYTNFMDGLCNVAKSQRGVLDFVHGDRVLMSFNASLRSASYARSAATAAVHIARDVGAPGLRGCVSIGIATGMAKIGNMGSKQMMKYNICGPVVGHAVRAQQLAYDMHDEWGVHIAGLVTEEMRMSVRTRALDIVQWRHMSAPVIVSEVVGIINQAGDEWMYELENSSEGDPFSRINKAIQSKLEFRGKTEFVLGETMRRSETAIPAGNIADDTVIAPSLCCNCSSRAKRTIGELAAYTNQVVTGQNKVGVSLMGSSEVRGFASSSRNSTFQK